ncbi:MAG: nucleotidyl transferase AbiEii/AbiGii toxin family protein [Rikenellaceae bacterium]
MNWIDLTIEDRRTILESLSVKLKLAPQSIEKDWWVTMVLKALFSSEFASHISFKGGTSLSKCFHLIDRFSEDVDIAIDREFLGFGGELSKTQVSDKLRRASCSFVREKLTNVIKSQLIELGISESEFEVRVNITSVTTTDPEIIEIHYKSIYPNDTDYIRNKVLVEVSGRSMSDPIEAIEVRSMIAEALPNTKYADAKFKLMAVSPKRTFIEKACLLHEEFAQTTRAVRVDRMSRHLYDLERMVASGIADAALADKELYRAVIEHRRKFIGLKGFDYSELLPQNISFVPPADIRKAWQEDYKSMQESMIYGSSLDFDELIDRITDLNSRFNSLSL